MRSGKPVPPEHLMAETRLRKVARSAVCTRSQDSGPSLPTKRGLVRKHGCALQGCKPRLYALLLLGQLQGHFYSGHFLPCGFSLLP